MKEELHRYLELNPTKKELETLRKMIHGLMAQSDDEQPEQYYVLAEFEEVMKRYPNTQYQNYYQVHIVPQEKEQHEKLQSNGVKMKSEFLGSGFTYTIEPVFNKDYADQMVREFRNLGFFCNATFSK